MKLTFFLLTLLLGMVVTRPASAAKRAMTLEDLFRFKRVSDPQISPDGKQVVYVVTSVEVEKNSSSSALWLVATDGKTDARALTNPLGKKDRHPRWSPDGKWILFESNRSGNTQLWAIALDGGEARQLTNLSTEASNGIWSPDGKHLAFVSAVFPEFSEKPFAESDALNKKKQEETEKSPVKARVFTKLFFRHWDSYVEDKRQHLFVIDFLEGRGSAPRDVTPGDRDAYPTSTTFSAGDDFTFSPNSKYLIFTATPEKNEAWSTNYDLCRVPVSGGKTRWESLTKNNLAADGMPRFSPTGKHLAFRSQKRAGYEADKWELMLAPCDASGKLTGTPQSLTAEVDLSVDELTWVASGPSLYFVAEANARKTLVHVSLESRATVVKLPAAARNLSGLSTAAESADLACTFVSLTAPTEVGFVSLWQKNDSKDGVLVRTLTRHNEALLAEIDAPKPESVEVPVEGGKMQMWILKPPGFDESKKWPVAYLVHGGPQGVWGDSWSFRWNPMLWAAQGYVVALPNPRGSTSFGQKFVDEIAGDWGGKCYDDLMKGADYVESLPYVDKERIGSAGASFGGYMMNWFAVNTGRFKTLITHCSVWNFDSMYGTTEELWFDEWEHGGPPWGKNRGSYEKHSPQRKSGNLGKFKTPMLIIHNDLDFRCPIGQGHELFTALQRQGVPARFINFPDEGHWVLKPKNSEFWHNEVFAWLKKYVPPGPR